MEAGGSVGCALHCRRRSQSLPLDRDLGIADQPAIGMAIYAIHETLVDGPWVNAGNRTAGTVDWPAIEAEDFGRHISSAGLEPGAARSRQGCFGGSIDPRRGRLLR